MLLAALLLLPAIPDCGTIDADLPTALAAWRTPAAELAPGAAVTIEAQMIDSPSAARAPHVASVRFSVDAPGVYGIALDQKGWIDVHPDSDGAAAFAPVAHSHGPECSSIAKIVRYRLAPGSYRVELSDLPRSNAKLMVTGPQ